ncbi:type III secretion system chaperone [Prosthecodimorpha staleyi]|uniref:Type III secretion system chaperone n=1 Tax=Prosthecodimorpha staleyi TaxID=2840188 RepID=A0A947DC61_9HYPH|nr:type III secretion system chaperone [Prosthecodimorpha staleyi]MBT9291914.1 type III secretion system chaperone [Prosthecodimorpha staleyi]
MGPNDISIMLARVAETAGWQSVTAYETSGLWVVELDAETEVAIQVEAERGLIYATVDAGALADATGSADETIRLLMTMNGEAAATGGLAFGLSPDGARITLAAPFALQGAEAALAAGLPALAARAGQWRTVLTAPAEPAQPLSGDEMVMRV